MEQVGLVVLGAVLALMTSIVVEFIKIQLSALRTKKLFKSLLKIDIPSILSSIDRLVEDYGKLGYIPILAINQIDASRQGYDRNRDWIILFGEENFQRDLISFYQQLSAVSSQANVLESLPLQHQQQNTDFVTRQRQELVAQFRDIAGRGRELLQRIDRQ